MSEKLDQLEKLNAQIERTLSDSWVFPTYGNVKGFLGTIDVMFVAERPSTGKFPSRSDLLLYATLEKYGVADAHLTDVIKTRGKGGEPYPDDIEPHRKVFKSEIEIIKPCLVVVFGQKTYDLLESWGLRYKLEKSGTVVRQVWHYSYTRRGKDKEIGFDNQIRQMLEKYYSRL